MPSPLQIPEALIKELRTIPGFREEAFMEAHAQPPVYSVRLHPWKHRNHFAGMPEVPWCPSGRYLSTRPVFTLDPDFHAGAYYVQEASSMFTDFLIRQLLPQRNGLRVLDICAAPGGKSTLLASLLEPDSLLIANETIRNRVTILEENAVRWGYTNHWVTCNAPASFEQLPGYFDLILADAPCSGSGLFRKNDHAAASWNPYLVQFCAARQERILHAAWKALKDNGWLIYATCSYSQQENEAILDKLASQHKLTQPAHIHMPDTWHIQETQSPVYGITGYRFFPDQVQGEGFFIAAIQKQTQTKTLPTPKFRSGHNKKLQQAASGFIRDDNLIYLQEGRTACCINALHEQDLQLLKPHLYFRKTGLATGTPCQQEWIPDHQLAMSIALSPDTAKLSLEQEDAIRFLKKETLHAAIPPKGWYLATHNGLALGWVKSLGNRINNYLPKNLRIRMAIP